MCYESLNQRYTRIHIRFNDIELNSKPDVTLHVLRYPFAPSIFKIIAGRYIAAVSLPVSNGQNQL